MTTNVRLFLMMVLQLAIWGAWAPKLFPYMTMLGFEAWQQSLVGSSWGVAALVGMGECRRRGVAGRHGPGSPWVVGRVSASTDFGDR